jgi:GNAT superfamily N-acetyltransferase
MNVVRKFQSDDKGAWQSLWRGYIEFYHANIPEEQYELTWKRLLDDSYNLHGLAVEVDGQIEGITHYSFQTSSWAPVNYCYLEDLYVNPELRGGGLGRALMDAVRDIAVEAGSSRLYWNTDATNETARKLYDSYVTESGKVQYRIQLKP